jgi:hypothetical protein
VIIDQREESRQSPEIESEFGDRSSGESADVRGGATIRHGRDRAAFHASGNSSGCIADMSRVGCFRHGDCVHHNLTPRRELFAMFGVWSAAFFVYLQGSIEPSNVDHS